MIDTPNGAGSSTAAETSNQTLTFDESASGIQYKTLTIKRPDDWHIHLRDDKALITTVAHAAQIFNRVMCMPNLVPPVKTAEDALAYRERILDTLSESKLHEQDKANFNPRMTLYLTDHTTVDDIVMASMSGIVEAVKLYPAGATTNSADGVTNLASRFAIFEAMQKHQLPLLIHGEVTHDHVDIFDREQRFVDEILTQLVKDFPQLKIVVEHITTSEAAYFVEAQSKFVAATITPQHLMFNRNHLLVGGIKPHFYCLPILKRQTHQQTLLKMATSGNPKFFIGTDSAPHATHAKENACGCAGCYSAPIALLLYATAFDSVNELDKLEGFVSHFGADYYGHDVNKDKVTLINKPTEIVEGYPYLDKQMLTPLMAGENLPWSYLQSQN